MMRQLGGSFGIALITTFMAKQVMVHRADLVAKLDANNPAIQNRVQTITQGMTARGIPANTASQDAYKLMDYSVMKQAMVLSYMDVFLYIGLMFLICVPFVLMVKESKRKKRWTSVRLCIDARLSLLNFRSDLRQIFKAADSFILAPIPRGKPFRITPLQIT